MEYVTTGHWIFAGVSFLIFIGVIVWSYRKDINIHKVHFKGASIFTLSGRLFPDLYFQADI